MSDVEALKQLAETAFQQAQYDQAKQYYEQLIPLEPEEPEHYKNLGNAFLRLNQLDAAESFYNKALAFKHSYWNAYFGLGLVYKAHQNFKVAINYFELALKQDSNNYKILADLAYAELQISNYKKAINYYKILLKNNYDIQNNLHNIAWCYKNIGFEESYYAIHKQLCVLYDNPPKSSHEVAEYCYKQNEYRKAVRHYEIAYEKGIKNSLSFIRYAECCLETGNLQQVKVYTKNYLKIHKMNFDVYKFWMQLLAEEGKYDSCLKMAEQGKSYFKHVNSNQINDFWDFTIAKIWVEKKIFRKQFNSLMIYI